MTETLSFKGKGCPVPGPGPEHELHADLREIDTVLHRLRKCWCVMDPPGPLVGHEAFGDSRRVVAPETDHARPHADT